MRAQAQRLADLPGPLRAQLPVLQRRPSTVAEYQQLYGEEIQKTGTEATLEAPHL